MSITIGLLIESAIGLLKIWLYLIESVIWYILPTNWKIKYDMTQETVLITGGGNGIGRVMAQKFAQLGAKVVIWDINTEGLEETSRLIKEAGGTVILKTVDITDVSLVGEVASEVRAELGCPVTILINNAGIVSGKSILDLSERDVRRTFEVNTLAHFWTIKAFLPEMIANGKGHVVSVISLAGLTGFGKLSDYSASKFAACGLLESLQAELLANNQEFIKTTGVYPAFINTGLFKGVQSRVVDIMTPEFVAQRIVSGVLTQQDMVIIPDYCNFIYMVKGFLPYKSRKVLYRLFGESSFMDNFTGRKPIAEVNENTD